MPLPKTNRLSLRLHKDEFSDGQKIHSKHFTLIRSTIHDPQSARPVGGSAQPQFAILVSKKTANKAHDRNKIRRLTSTAIQNLLYQFSPGQYLFIPKSSLLTSPFSDILSDLSTILPRIHNS